MKIFVILLKVLAVIILFIVTQFFCIHFLSSKIVSAQVSPDDTFQIIMNPEVPDPNQEVLIRLESYSFDINRSNIAWLVNGRVVQQGIGSKSFSINSGNSGTSKIITIDVTDLTDVNHKSYQKSVTIKPQSLDLVWEADSYTPPFYKGKSQFSYQSTVTISAVTFPYNSKKLVYAWKLNGNVMSDQSGYGQDSIVIKASIITRPIKISVSVSPIDNSFIMSKNLTLRAGSPQVLFYEDNPLYGVMYNKALQNNYELNQDEIKIVAIPYFFSGIGIDNITYQWGMNDHTINSYSTPDTIILRRPNQGGQSTISALIENTDKILQQAQNSISIIYANKNSAQ